METIHFTKEPEAEGHRIIMTSGPVIYTGRKGVYKVPNYVLDLLDEAGIAYKIVEERKGGKTI